jgi:hypothetical protein
MKKEQMNLFPTCDLGQAMMAARDLLAVAYDYVATWGDVCLEDLETPAFVREIYSQSGLNAMQRAG